MKEKRDNEMLVHMRNRMVEDIYEAIEVYMDKGIKSEVTEVIKRIMETEGYTVDLACEEEFYQRGTRYEQKHIKILEDDEGFEIRIFIDEDKVLRQKYDHYMLRTHKENLAESRAEIEAERKMSLWASGYRPHLEYMDDPRGY